MSINLKAFWGTLNNVSFHLKTAAMGALPLMISYVYIYNLFGNDAWQKELALVSYAQMMPQLALAHLVNVNQLMCSAAFLVAFLGLREECPDGSINDIPTLWSMLWFKTMCIYATQVGLYFAWPLMLLNGCGHTGGSFFGVLLVVLIGLLVAICSVTQYYYFHPVAGYLSMFGIAYMSIAVIFVIYWFVCSP